MATTTKTMAATNGRRDHELRKMLEDRRRQLVYEVLGKLRDERRDYSELGYSSQLVREALRIATEMGRLSDPMES